MSAIPSNYFVVVDQGGANDVNAAQVDLTQFGRDDSNASAYKLFWSWDATDQWTGAGQTGDACALFDSNNDGNINFAVCGQIQNQQDPTVDPSVVVQTAGSPYVFSCSDHKDDRCTNPSPVSASGILAGALTSGNPDTTAGANLITPTDPFPNLKPDQDWPNDSTLEVVIPKSTLPAGAQLVNVCSYPSAGNGGNNNPFDCIVNPGGGFLVIKKVAPSGSFGFSVDGGAAVTVAAGGSSGAIPLVIGTSHTVAENVPSGWALVGASCSIEGGGSTGTLAGSTLSDVEIDSGKITTCTFTDSEQTGTLKVVKDVVNDNGGTLSAGDFSLHVLSGGSDVAGSPQPGSATGTVYTLAAGQSYEVSEDASSGYSASYSSDCKGTIAADTEKVCTVTNDDKLAHLTLDKIVVNDNGGTAKESNWTLTATGPTTLSGPGAAGHTDVVSGSDFKAGTYTLSESGGPTDYTASPWSCVTNQGAAVQGDSVDVGPGDNVVCTITNDDKAATLVVKKVVVNDNGGSKIASDFSFVVNGGNPTAFVQSTDALHGENTLTLSAGTYTVTEPAVAGYATTYSNCANVVIANGETQTCTITNNDVAVTPPPTTTTTTTTTTPTPTPTPTTTTAPPATPPAPSTPQVDLSLTKDGAPNPVTLGNQIVYTLTITNKALPGSSDPATNVTLTDPVPSGLTFGAANSTQGACTIAGNGLTCDIGTMAPGDVVTITLVAAPSVTGAVTNTAVVTSAEPDVNPADNTASATTAVHAPFTPPAAPPATKPKPKVVAPTCSKVTATPLTLKVGNKTIVVVKARDQKGKPLAKAFVKLRGPGILVRGKTNAHGVYKRKLAPKKPGIVVVRVAGPAACVDKIGVVGIFQPPVTG